ncbi:cobalamin biosynthesis protein CobQ [Cryobacterium sp. Y57]|uniref:MinD/ParA family ATP-binding protein n=1 Tax=Cryobacterium sp. Y57 TaxID=2048287 RepID=UPI000CE4B0F7|nr:cobalamin biosynthesis protein CobQ [Cryobacterium sp. Y57]
MSPNVPALANTPADIVATVQTDTTGEVTIDGSSHRVTSADEAGVREEIIGLVVETARRRGQSVLLQVSDEQGDWPLTVHPNGRVESAGPVVVADRPKPASTAPVPVVIPHEGPIPFATLMQPTVTAPPTALFESLVTPAADTASAVPNLADFLSSRPPAPAGPAALGWQGALRRLSGGFVSPTPSPAEQRHRTAIAAVQRSLNGPRTIVVLNPKGGAHKTTATLLIAATFGIYRGGYTLAWDNNETMGTLGVRAQAARHTNTAVDLLRDLDRFGDARSRVGDLDNYVRSQGDAQFDALASDLDPAGAASIDDDAFRKLHTTLSRFYRVLVIDTGNNMRASNWEAAVDTADQLVIVSTIREDTGYGAASLIDGLRQKGHADKVAEAVTVLASPSKTADEQLSKRLHDHFRQLTRTVVDVPYDASLVGGGPLKIDALAPRTRAAWVEATAAIAEGL